MVRSLIVIVALGWFGIAHGDPAPARPPAAAPAAAKGPEGTWMGTLAAGAVKLRLAFHIERLPDGTLRGAFDSLDQGLTGIPLDKVTYNAPTLRFELAKAHLSYEGKLDGDQVVGTMTQGVGLALNLTRVDKIAALNRPQTPKPPFPYRSEDVSIAVLAAPLAHRPEQITLAGTLVVPAGKGPFPAVVFVTGSGPQDRDETLFEHRPFLVLADALARRGVASLRVDDRGVGKSAGDPKGSTTLDFAEDVRQELAWLAARPEVDKRALGVVGHSEGGLIGPIVASHTPLARFVVMLAGTGMDGGKVLMAQAALIGRAMGAPEAKLARDRADSEKLYAQLRAAKTDAAWTAAVQAFAAGQGERADASRMLSGPWMRTFITLDPVPYLEKVRVPVLAISGDHDLQVPPDNLPLIEAALKRGKNPDATVRLIPGVNHLFQHTKTGLPSEYGELEETLAPEVLQLVTDWIVERAARLRK